MRIGLHLAVTLNESRDVPPRSTSDGPDLFDWSVKPAAPSKSAEAKRPPILPSNLAGSLAHLTDSDFERLVVAVTEEAKRRGAAEARNEEGPRHKGLRKVRSARATGAIAAAKANLVRAAFRAGVKPNTIARQFGLPTPPFVSF
jgi:hypothetical protein